MPHGWAIAEFHLLLRDCLIFEDRRRLVLFAGVPEMWFTDRKGMQIKDLPTHFGSLDVSWTVTDDGAVLRLGGDAAPHAGYVLSLPASPAPTVTVEGEPVEEDPRGYLLPANTREARIRFGSERTGGP
jgi:hypothetical protein